MATGFDFRRAIFSCRRRLASLLSPGTIVGMPGKASSQAAQADQPASPTALLCLTIIARHHGVDLSVEQLRADNRLASDTISTGQLFACARRAGFRCRALFGKWDDLVRVAKDKPAIVRLKDGSSMVLMGTRREAGMAFAVLQDPNAADDAPLVIDRIRFEAAWTGDLIVVRRGLKAAGGEEAQPFGPPLLRTLLGKERGLLSILVVCSAGLGLLNLAPLLFVRLLIDRVMVYQATKTLVGLGLVLFVLIVAETIFGAVRRFVLARLIAHTDAKLATALYDRVLALPMSYFERHALGQTVARMGQLDAIRRLFGGALVGTVLDVGILLVILPVMLYVSPGLTACVLLIAALVVGAVVLALPRFDAESDGLVEADTRRASFLAQVLKGMRTVKSLALDEGQRERWAALNLEAAGRRRTIEATTAVLHAAVVAVERLLVAGTFAYGIFMSTVSVTPVAVGTLVLFYLLTQRLLAPLADAATLVGHYEAMRSAVEGVGGLMNHPSESRRSPPGRSEPLQGRITFDAVSFTYRGAPAPTLKSVSFDLAAGQTLGIMGPSGAGKSTIAHLLQRLYGDVQGSIAIDGVDIKAHDLGHLRRGIAVVAQDSFLFRGTIRETITAARHDAGFDDMVLAARLAGADEFIDKLPRGYETVIHEGSPNLSTGQRQRLALARALITNPRVLVLDEATSALDGDIEALVSSNIRHIARGRTMIVISHRLASLVSADAIMVLDGGEVRDIGRHHDLLERCELYSSQWHRQHETAEGETPIDKLLALS